MSMYQPYYNHYDINSFKSLCQQTVTASDYPMAEAIEKNVVIYDGQKILNQTKNIVDETIEIRAEWNRALKSGPGVLVIKNAYKDLSIIDKQSETLKQIITEEKQSGIAKGDHFGDNERIWNALQKACIKDPDNFIDYYGNSLLATICLAWLGPGYQITAQVNNVKKGSQAQIAHRDYHLGFQSLSVRRHFPLHAQLASQYLTLQGAIAHGDIPISSGPTMLLPFSQQYELGYITYERPEFIDYFNQNFVQLPLNKGDMLFFNPALYHGAGENHNEADRLVNLVQISSPFGKTMEALNHHDMILATYPKLLTHTKKSSRPQSVIDNIIATVADGYSFPTNLDFDAPIGGNAPKTQQQLMTEALSNQWPIEKMHQALDDLIKNRNS